MTALESFFASFGLLWERLHLISAGTVQTTGVRCRWSQDLEPIGNRAVGDGELVELRVTCDKDHAIVDATTIRFDILEFDWLFAGGFDDPVACLKPPAAGAPQGDFTIVDREVEELTTSDAQPTLRAVIDEFRVARPADFEKSIVVVRDAASGVTEVIGWWRAARVDDAGDHPQLYFVAEIPGARSSTTSALSVDAAPVDTITVRLHGTITDAEAASGQGALPVPDAAITIAGRSAHTTHDGAFVLDVRMPTGSSTLTVTRRGIDQRRLTATLTAVPDGPSAVQALDEGRIPVAQGTLAAHSSADQFVVLALDLKATVHRVSGTVQWPATWTPTAPITLAGRYVYAIPLGPGAVLPQRPATSRAWEALRTRPDVQRSARPGRAAAGEPTAADGRFEISFLDLTPGSRWLLWVEGTEPRPEGGRTFDAVVRTVAAPQMRTLGFAGGALTPDQTDRRVIDSTYNLLADSVAGVTEVLTVTGTVAARVVHRPGRAHSIGIDATPVTDTDPLTVDAARPVASGLTLEVLPLCPVFEATDQQGAQARARTSDLHDHWDGALDRGYLLSGLRWVLDARRGPTADWSNAAACAALETTLLTHPKLAKDRIDDGTWPWWRADAVSAADAARVASGGVFAARTLEADLVPLLGTPSPRLLGLFDGRHLHLSPGHGTYQQPPIGYVVHSNRASYAGNTAPLPVPPIQNWAGEDENAGGLSFAVTAHARANGASVTATRESLDPTRLGWVDDPAAGRLVQVDPALHPDHPRLWQQNAYYWIAAEWDSRHPGAEIVVGHEWRTAALVGVPPTTEPVDAAGINRRLGVFTTEANGDGVDAFLALHTNASAPSAQGFLATYLDVRATPTAAAPGAAGYVEHNPVAEDVAIRLATALAGVAGRSATAGMPAYGGVPTTAGHPAGVRSYFAIQGNTARELATTFHCFSSGMGSQAMRSAVPGAGLQDLSSTPDLPVGYLELGFHSNVEDCRHLSQGWFRNAAGAQITEAMESVVLTRSRPVDGADLRSLLTRTFGALPAIGGLPGSGQVTPNDVAAAITAITGSTRAVPTTALADVVSAIEAERATVTRGALARQLADAAATVAGWDAAAAAQAEPRARAAYSPVLRALGAPSRIFAPAAGTAPDVAEVPRAHRPATRADAAAVLGAVLGLVPATLRTVTAPLSGPTLLAAAAPEDPEAFVPAAAMAAAVTAIGQLPRTQLYRLRTVRVVDPYGRALSGITAGREVILAIDTIGTAWPGLAAAARIVLARGGSTVAVLDCTARDPSGFTSAMWTVTSGTGPFDVSVTIGLYTLGPVQWTPEVIP